LKILEIFKESQWILIILAFLWRVILVLLPGFQKGRDIKASEGKGQGAVLAKKGHASYKEKHEK
jgi:hypothetical protein